MIIFGSLLTAFEASSSFLGSWGSFKNWLNSKIIPKNQANPYVAHGNS